MARVSAAALALFLLSVAACSRDGNGAPAPDVAGQPIPAKAPAAPVAEAKADSPEEAASAVAEAPAQVAAPGYKPGSREPDYQHIAEVRNAREASTGKLARMYLKFNYHHEWLENTVKMLATDGSYLSVLLHYDEGFKPTVLNMKKGFVYEIEFEVTEVSSGGQPRGNILSIDRRSSGPVADQTRFLPAIEAVQAARELPEHVKEARRERMREDLEKVVEAVEQSNP